MATNRIAARAAATVWIMFASAALGQEGSAAQREACTPDALRLCGQYIPDASAIATCLRHSGPRLSPECHAVFYPSRAELRNARRGDPPPASDSEDGDE